MDDERKSILTAAIRHYTAPTQIGKAIEELSELIRALARLDDWENIAEEMADVKIMLDQMEIIFKNREAVQIWELRKLRRLALRTAGGED
jgi:hypothetical protein